MMVRNSEDAVKAAMATTSNFVGQCQKYTRGWFDAPSAGDQDGDGDADANDGWKFEPVSARHYDRTPPKGKPLYFKNRSGKGFGHRCISRDVKGGCRSTDMSNGRYAAGKTGNATIAQIEKAMNLIYVGWSDTIDGVKIPASKPTKPPTGTKPPVKKSATFKIATANVQSLPKLKSISKQLASVSGTHLFGFQEVDPKDYKKQTLTKFPQAIGIGTLKTPRGSTYSCPIAYARGTFDLVRSATHKIYDGESGISLTRHLTSAVFKHKPVGFGVGMVNLHSVLMKGANQAKRKAMKAETKAVTFATVRKHLANGLPVVITGDFNDTANWFGKSFDGHKVTVVKHGIDQVVLINGPGHTWTVVAHSTRATPSDHDTLRVEVTLAEK